MKYLLRSNSLIQAHHRKKSVWKTFWVGDLTLPENKESAPEDSSWNLYPSWPLIFCSLFGGLGYRKSIRIELTG